MTVFKRVRTGYTFPKARRTSSRVKTIHAPKRVIEPDGRQSAQVA